MSSNERFRANAAIDGDGQCSTLRSVATMLVAYWLSRNFIYLYARPPCETAVLG